MASEFNRKVEPTKNIVISSLYRDMYMGQQQTANIGGGHREQAYLSRFTLPSTPTYGGGELERLDYHVYVNSIDLAQNVYAFPEISVYKTKNSKRLSITEGMQKINETKTKDVLMFASHLNGSCSIDENFDGTNQAHGDAVIYKPVQRMIIRDEQLYVTPSELKNKGREITWGMSNFDNQKESTIKTNYAVLASDLGIKGIIDNDVQSSRIRGKFIHGSSKSKGYVCKVKPAKEMNNWGKEKLDWVVEPKEGKSGYKKIYIHKDDEGIIQHGDRSTVPNTDLYGDELTPSNSIFEIVRGSKEIFGEQTKGEAAVELLMTGAARLSTAAHLTGAQSGELYTYWKKDTLDAPIPAKGTFKGGSTGTNETTRATGTSNIAGPANRQEVMLCKKNLLFPLKHPSKPYRRGAAASATSQDVNDFANNIEMDIKIKTLAKAYGFGNTSTGYYTLRRAFVVCFSEEQPLDGESFFEFVWKHRDRNQLTGTLSRGGATNKLTRIMDYNSLDYGKPLTYTIVAGGTGYSASATNATTRDLAAGSTIPSNGAGITVNTTVSGGGAVTAAAVAGYPDSTTGYRVGDILTLTGGNSDAKVSVATIERYTKAFTGVAIIDTENGFLISDSSLVGAPTTSTKPGGGIVTPGTGSPQGIGQSKQKWWLDETLGDVVIPKASFNTSAEIAESFMDEWVRLNFLMGAQSERIVPHSATNYSATALANGAGSATTSLVLDNNVGTIVVGDYVVGINDTSKLVRVTATNGTTTATLDGTATWADDQSLRFYSPNSGGFGKEVSGMADGTWGRLLVSKTSDGQLIQRTNDLSVTTNPEQFWSLNSSNGEAPYSDISKWTKYMSIWMLNYPASHDVTTDEDNLLEKNTDMSSQVFIDRISFKDFNYAMDNPNYNDRNKYPDKIAIKPSTTAVGPDGTLDNNDIRSDKTSQYNINAPTMLSFGTTNPAYLGYKTTNEAKDVSHYNWCSDRQGWLMLHGFRTENLANLKEIPDENICATYTHAGGLTTGKSKWGECYNTHYGMGGFQGEAANPALHHNAFEGFADPPGTNIGLKYLWTGLESSAGYTATDTFVLEPEEDDDTGPMGAGNRMHWPIRPGDTIVFPTGDDSSNTTVETALVEDVDLSGTENYTITTAANISELDAADSVYIHPEGMVDNFSKKGMIFFDPNTEIQVSTGSGDFSTTSSVNWARRECGPVSSRVLDVVDSTAYTVDFLVDTLNPLQLDMDEQYIIYVYGGGLEANFFTSDNTTTTVDATANNAKSGILLKSLNAETNVVTFEWDGKANDGTPMITDTNLPALMISPYRYWIHMNVDCSDFDSGAPTTTLPARGYDSFSVMENNFAEWDGSTYFTGTVDESLNATDVTFDVTDASDIVVGDTIMVDDEAMYVRATNVSGQNTVTVIRGASSTWTDNVANQSTNILTRTGATHATGAKIKNVTVHTAWGEYMTGNATKMTKDGILGGDGTAASGLTARRNLGSTFSEYLINHETTGGVSGAYINTWQPTVLKEGTILETGMDFGYGSYDESEDTGGQLSTQIVRQGEYNNFKMHGIGASDDFEPDSQIDLLLKYKDDTTPHVTNINTRLSNTNKPYAVAIFKDELPVTPKLTVKPYKEDPFLPEFTWEASDNDLWYGLLHIDSKNILSQYHNSILHLPFDEEGDHGNTATAPKNKSFNNNSDTGTGLETSNMSTSGPIYDLEGLAGNCLRFDGNNDYVDYNPASGDTFTDITDEFTFIFHIIPDIDIAGASNYIATQYPIQVNFNATTSQIDVRIYASSNSSAYVELKSSALPVDGETPTAIIVTFDKNLKAGNCKLFIDGRLEDQSGLAMATIATGANNNWRSPDDAATEATTFRVGASSNSFDGRIEEVVVYNKCLYPIVPSDGTFVLSKPLKEISNSSPISYIARLFVKDYHNIRGSTPIEVACSSPVSWRKSAFRLVD